MVKPAAKQTVTTSNSHSCPKQRASFHLLPESNFLFFFLSIFRSTFYHLLFDVMRLQRYAFIGQMTLLSSKSSGNPDDGGGRRAGSAHVNLVTSAGYMTTSFGPATLSGNVLTMTATSTGQLGQYGKFYPFRCTQ